MFSRFKFKANKKSVYKKDHLSFFGKIYDLYVRRPFGFFSLGCKKFAGLYTRLTCVPYAGVLFKLPISIFNVVTLREKGFPVFPSHADIVAYLVRLRQENIKIKGISFLLVGCLAFVLASGKDFLTSGFGSSHVAKIKIHGKIDEASFGTKEFFDMVDKVEKDKKVLAIILEVNSPGGAVYPSEMLYKRFRELAKVKPMIALITDLAASGGYLAAISCDKIYAGANSSGVGSIGVISQNIEYTELASKLGVKMDMFKSSPLKASPNPYEKTTQEMRVAVMETIDDIYDFFKSTVQERRNMTNTEISLVANGKVFTGRMALRLKLVDAIGTEKDVLQLWKDNGVISQDTEVKEVVPQPSRQDKKRDRVSSRLFRGLVGYAGSMIREVFIDSKNDRVISMEAR